MVHRRGYARGSGILSGFACLAILPPRLAEGYHNSLRRKVLWPIPTGAKIAGPTQHAFIGAIRFMRTFLQPSAGLVAWIDDKERSFFFNADIGSVISRQTLQSSENLDRQIAGCDLGHSTTSQKLRTIVLVNQSVSFVQRQGNELNANN